MKKKNVGRRLARWQQKPVLASVSYKQSSSSLTYKVAQKQTQSFSTDAEWCSCAHALTPPQKVGNRTVKRRFCF